MKRYVVGVGTKKPSDKKYKNFNKDNPKLEVLEHPHDEWIRYEEVEEALNIVRELANHNRPQVSIRELIKRAKAFEEGGE